MNNRKTLFALIRNEIAGTPLPRDLKINFKELYTLSKRHDLAHIVFYGLIKNGLLKEDNDNVGFAKANKQVLMAIVRYQQQNHELKRISELFNENNIRFVPLKGSIIRDYYPEPWMRTSCDIDILIHEEDLDKASKSLLSLGYFSNGVRNYHDISFFLNNVHVELHFNICENNKQLDTGLKGVWNSLEQYDRCEYREKSSFFMYHHIAHMAYHFLSGGCGIRPVLDLWILRKKYNYDENDLLTLIKKSHLVSFYNNACLLSEIWFGKKQHNKTTFKMEQYIIDGGLYGTAEKNAVTGIALHKGSKLKYKLSVAFPPYESMCNMYPALKKCIVLLPFCYIHRVFSKTFGKKGKKARKRAKTINKSSQEEISDLLLLIDELGLNK